MPVAQHARNRRSPKVPVTPAPIGVRSLHAAWIAVALFIGTLVIFWPSLDHQFIEEFDDHLYITKNLEVQEGLHAGNVYWVFTSTVAQNWHPLTMISHMLDVELYGLNPRGHHLTNILLHAAATVLLFLVLLRMTHARWSSALVAALFSLHPMHVESVAWIAERKDVLSACFWFLTTWFFVRYTERPGLRRYWPILFFFALGLMSKPMLVTLPCTLLLLDLWPLNRIPRERAADLVSKKALRLVVEKLPLFAMAFAVSVITVLVQSGAGAMAMGETLSPGTRIANAAVSYVTYVVKTIWLADYAVFYPHAKTLPPLWQVFGALLLLGLITAATLWWARRQPQLVVGWFWFLGTLVPVIGIVQVGFQSMADRYSYIPSIGLFIMFVWGAIPAITRALGRPVAIACAVLILLCLTVATRLQLGYWRDSETLFRHALAVTENNYTANYAVGAALMREDRFNEAEGFLAEAARLQPDDAFCRKALGDLYYVQGKLSEAYASFAEVERLDPGTGIANFTMGLILERMGQPDESRASYEKAVADFRAILEQKPGDPLTMLNLAAALEEIGKDDEALPLYQEVLRVKPELLSPDRAEAIRRRAL